MIETGVLKIGAQGDKEIVYTRGFAAPRGLVFEAHTKPELVQRWLGVRAGWTLPVCEIDLRVGGKYRFVWKNEARGIEMGMGGEYVKIITPELISCTERFDQAWYPGDCLVTQEFFEEGERTLLKVTLGYENAAARDGVLASPMESGLAESYDELARILEAHAS